MESRIHEKAAVGLAYLYYDRAYYSWTITN